MVLALSRVVSCCTYDGVDGLGGLCVSDAEGDVGFCCNIRWVQYMECIQLSRETCTKLSLIHI